MSQKGNDIVNITNSEEIHVVDDDVFSIKLVHLVCPKCKNTRMDMDGYNTKKDEHIRYFCPKCSKCVVTSIVFPHLEVNGIDV